MTNLTDIAPDFVAAAHAIVYCTVGSVDAGGRPTSRVMHPIWEWDGERLTGWLTTTPSPKVRQLAAHPYVSCAYYDSWAVAVVADCRVEPVADDAARTRIWELFKATPPPLGYDPGAIGVPGWDGPTAPGFVLARVEPWRVQVRRVATGRRGGAAHLARAMIAAVDEQAALLREVPLFASLPDARLHELAALARPVSLRAGAVLFERGDPGDALYVIRHGRLEVVVDGAVVREAGRGEVLGELALLTGEPRNATVRARRDSELYAVRRADLDVLLADPGSARALVRHLAARIPGSAAPAPVRADAVLALVPLDGTPPALVRRLADRLAAELGRYARLTRLDGADAENGPARLDAAEAAHELVLLVAEHPDDAWARFCLRQADRRLVVVDAARHRPADAGRGAAGPLPGPRADAGRRGGRGPGTAPRRGRARARRGGDVGAAPGRPRRRAPPARGKPRPGSSSSGVRARRCGGPGPGPTTWSAPTCPRPTSPGSPAGSPARRSGSCSPAAAPAGSRTSASSTSCSGPGS